jgi:hypothetical protein
MKMSLNVEDAISPLQESRYSNDKSYLSKPLKWCYVHKWIYLIYNALYSIKLSN